MADIYIDPDTKIDQVLDAAEELTRAQIMYVIQRLQGWVNA